MKRYSKTAQLHFCFDRKNKSQAFRMEAVMSEPISDDVLLDALKKTLKLFPTAACRPVITADRKYVGMEPNSTEPVIYHDETPAALGTDETNGYLFRVISIDRTIVFSAFHALSDARGAHMFLASLLWFYLTGLGYDVDPEGYVPKPEEIESPDFTDSLDERLDAYGVSGGYVDPEAPPREMIFHDAREDELYDKDVFSVSCAAMPFSEVRQITKALGTTPLILFTVLGAQAMRETAEVGDKVIQCCFAADLRGRLNSRSPGEFSGAADIYYYPDDEKLPFEDQLKKAKASFDRGMEHLEQFARSMLDGYEDMLQYLDLTTMDRFQPLLSRNGKVTSSSMFLSNMGAFRFPKGMEPYLQDVRIYGTPVKYDATIGMHTFGDTLYLTYMHNTTDDSHLDRMADKLRELGVACRTEYRKTTKLDYLGRLNVEWKGTPLETYLNEHPLRAISVTDGMQLASGTTADVYRLDEGHIAKIYHPGYNPEWIEAQRKNAYTLYSLGIPSAAVYDPVFAGGRIGAVYEYVDAPSLGEAITREPGRLKEYAEKLSCLMKKVHRAKPDRSMLTDTLEYISDHFNVFAINRYTDMDVTGFAVSINQGNTLVHADFHPMNVVVRDGELLLIDTGDAYYRYGFLDHVTLYSALMVQTDTEEKAMLVTKMSRENAHMLWDAFVDCYFSPESPEEKESINALLSRVSKIRIAMSIASMNEIAESMKSDLINKLLGAIEGSLDEVKKEIDAFETRYELT